MIEPVLLAHGFREHGELWTDEDRQLGAVPGGGGLLVGWIDVVWPDPSIPEPQLQDVRHLTAGTVEFELETVLAELRAARERALRDCRFCQQRVTPGRMHSGHVCQGCAERELGVVH